MLSKCQLSILLILLANNGTIIISCYLRFLEKALSFHSLTKQNSFIWFDAAFWISQGQLEKRSTMNYETWNLVQEWELGGLEEKLGKVKVQEGILRIRGVTNLRGQACPAIKGGLPIENCWGHCSQLCFCVPPPLWVRHQDRGGPGAITVPHGHQSGRRAGYEVEWSRGKLDPTAPLCLMQPHLPSTSNDCCFASSFFKWTFWPILIQNHTVHCTLIKIDLA